MALYLRDLPGLTLRDLANEVNVNESEWGGTTNEVGVELSNDNFMSFRLGGTEVPATRDGMEQLATFMDVPRPFLLRLDPDMQASLMGELLRRNAANLTVHYTESGIHEVHRPSKNRLKPAQIVQTAINVIGEQGELAEWNVDSDEMFFDVMVPEGFDRGVGGDLERNDISRGGLRFQHNRKQNLAPKVDTFLYRVLCTNGLVVPETGATVDARGSSVQEVLAELEYAAQVAFGQVEEQLEHFYGLRQQRIEGDVTQAVMRVANERGLPDRTAMTLARRVPDQLDPETLGHPVSMFDIVNLITNQANHPDLRSRRSSRRALETAGGDLVREVHERCHTCHQSIA